MSWMEDVDLSTLSPNEQDEFKSAMGDYKTLPDALIGGYNAKKISGKNYKLPKSVESLPSEEMRNEFLSETRKLLKVEPPITNDTIKQVNFKKGLAEGKEANELVKTKLSEFAVKEGIGLTKLQNLIEFVNSFGEEISKTASAELEQATKDAIKKTGEALDLYYGAEKRKENAELLRKAIQNNCDLSTEEVEQLAGDLADDGYIFQKPALAKVLMDKIAPLAKEGDTIPKGDTAKEKTKRKLADEGFTKTAAAIGLE